MLVTAHLLPQPPGLFDRADEWAALAGFSDPGRPAPRLGLVHGRRRHGKSHLLRALAAATSGLYLQAVEEERGPALDRLGRLVGGRGPGARGITTYRDWEDGLRDAIERAAGRPIVIDELPYLLAGSPELPSVLQLLFDEAAAGSVPGFRLILCGSAFSVMSRLLAGGGALRGRAVMELALLPFDHRQAAAFWGIGDPATAFLVDAVVGGTPGYRTLFDGAVPAGPGELFDWLAPTAFDPRHALFREADHLLAEDPALVDRALYQSVLALIADGHETRRALADRLRRDDSAVRHPLLLLERAGLIRREEDLLRQRRPLLRIDDPFLRFHFAVVRPDPVRWESGDRVAAWRDAQPRLTANVLGPHFERLARIWTARFAGERALGGRPTAVGPTQVNDPSRRTRLELDVVAVAGNPAAARPTILAIGEAKATAGAVGIAEVRRLERARTLLAERADTRSTKLLVFSRGTFSGEVRAEASRRDDLGLVDLERLYGGD